MSDINKRPKGEGKRYRGNPNLMKARRQIDDIQSRLDKVKTQPPTSAKYPDKLSFTKADKEQKDKANQQSIKNLKRRKPHLYKEGWLTEGYKKIDKMKDLARTSNQINRLDSDAAKAAEKGDYAKEFRKDQQGANVQTHFALRNTPNLAGRNKIANIKQSARNQMIGARDRKYGIKPTRRRKLKADGFHDNYVDKLRRKKVEEGYKKPDHVKMIKQIKKHKEDNIRKGPDPQELSGKYRNSSKNRAFKMHSIRGALKRGEDPRRDTVGGRQKTPIDRRKEYTYNQKDRPAKKPGVQKEGFVVNEEQKPLPMDKMRKQSDRHFKNVKTELGKARNSRDQAKNSTDVRRFRRQQFNKDQRTDKVADFVRRRNTIDNEIDKRNSNPRAYASKRSRKSNRNKAIGKMKRMM